MHDGIAPIEHGGIERADVSLHDLDGVAYGVEALISKVELVVDPNGMPAIQKLTNRHAPDVTGATSNENHVDGTPGGALTVFMLSAYTMALRVPTTSPTQRDVTELHGLQVFEAASFRDPRGYLLRSWVRSDLASRNIPTTFQQAIQTFSHRGVVRGLHFQWDPPMGKLVRCVHGAVLDVVVDVRVGSPTLGCHAAVELRGDNHRIIWVPPGFAHGTFALEDDSIVLYECTTEHAPNEGGILWNDPELAIAWPNIDPIVSDKDEAAPTLADWLQGPNASAFSYPSAPSA